MIVIARRAMAAAAVAGLAFVGGCSSPVEPGSQTGFVPGDHNTTLVAAADRQTAPDLSGALLGGGSYSLADERGDDVVVINVWGSWCPPCRAEAPAFQQVYEEVQDQGVQFLGINTRDDEASAQAFVRKYGISYPSLVDEGGELQIGFADSLPVAAIPTTLIIDRQGRVAARALSDLTYDGLRDLLRPVLDEDEAGTVSSAP